MLKRMNRKGATEGSTIIGLIIAILVLVLVAYFLMKGFGIFTDPFENPDFDRVLLENTCKGYLSSSESGYCLSPYMIKQNAYINCDYAFHNYNIKLGDYGDINCETTYGSEYLKNICIQLRDEMENKYQPEKVKINRKSCSELGVGK